MTAASLRDDDPDRAGDGALGLRAASLARAYLTGSVEREGIAATGVAIDGVLAGLRAFLVERLGPEAAYGVFQRQADAVIQERAQPPPSPG